MALHGLSESEAAARLRTEGPNELPTGKARSFLESLWAILREPMILLLLGAGLIYVLLGEMRDSVVLLISIFVIVGIELYQERKIEHALEALRDLTSPRAMVIREGRQRRIAGREVVRGDVVIVSEGDRIPADGVLLTAVNLTVDESLLTGESVPVRKRATDQLTASMDRPGGDDSPFVFSGTLAVQGQGYAEIRATGTHSEIGKIGRALKSIENESTRLEAEVNRLARVLATAGLSLCGIIALVYGLQRGNWMSGLLVGITTAISLLPEEFPVVLTVFLALGAWRISRKQVLTRQRSAIEALGAATVLCVDKTGTLTQNRMQVNRLFAGGRLFDATPEEASAPGEFRELMKYSVLASKRNPLDPMETALQEFGARHLLDSENLNQNWALVREYPLSPALLAMSRVWQPAGSSDFTVAAKGAPEAIARLCNLSGALQNEVLQAASQMADQGLRILGVAKCAWQAAQLPTSQLELPFSFVGLVALADPIRPEVPAAVKECYAAGIRVVMITGDYAGTAQSIARQIGLASVDQVITGPELALLSESELQQRVHTTNIFARVVPEQKLRLVNALKKNGEIVAMTGDGVNDAPALKSAQIGIAMGARGTDVAREAADLVLMEDSFSSIVAAIGLGRRIFDNMRKAMSFVLSIHVPIAGLALIPILGRYPLVLMPVHIVFLELIVDPACSIAFEAEPAEPGLMQRPPRNPKDLLLPRRRILLSILQGASVLVVTVALFALARHMGESEANTRTLTFVTLVIGNLMLILANRSSKRTILETLRSPNPVLYWIVGGAFAMLLLVTTVPFLQQLFRFGRLHPLEMGLGCAGGMASLLWLEGWKLLKRKPQGRQATSA